MVQLLLLLLPISENCLIYQKKCIEPLWESKPDWEIYKALAKRLRFLGKYAEGNSEEDWIKKVFNISSLPKYVSYEEFKKVDADVLGWQRDHLARQRCAEPRRLVQPRNGRAIREDGPASSVL